MTQAINPAPISAALALLREDLGGVGMPAVSSDDMTVLAKAAPDPSTLKRWLKRRIAGEPLAYILGGFHFDGHWFTVDARAYITDPELIHLVNAVADRIEGLRRKQGRAPLVVEFGVGCGSLALSLKSRVPTIDLVGIDLDPRAMDLATQNSARLALPLRLIEADLFEPWPDDLAAPDLIYGDPPWGDAETLYAKDRLASHYAAMPAASAFPLGGRAGVHAQILRTVGRFGWTTEIWLNCGVLPDTDILALTELTAWWEILRPVPSVALLHCRVRL